MKFCPVVPEICRGQVHGPRKERRRKRRKRIIIIIIIRNGAKRISLLNKLCGGTKKLFLQDLVKIP
jgi:chemotaxis receptor (MCP) glutamine deamidase CheD